MRIPDHSAQGTRDPVTQTPFPKKFEEIKQEEKSDDYSR